MNPDQCRPVLIYPAIFSVLLVLGVDAIGLTTSLSTILIIDSAHTFLTLQAIPGRGYLQHGIIAGVAIPLLIGVGLSIDPAGISSFLFYFTIFHHLRQWEGLGLRSGARTRSLRISLLCTAAVMHTTLTDQVYLFAPNERLFILPLDMVLLASGIIFVFDVFKNKEDGVLLSALTWWPFGFQTLCFLIWPQNSVSLLPLLLAHSIQYFMFVNESTPSTSRRWIWATLPIFLILGSYLESTELDPSQRPFLSGLLVTPMIWHYWMDGWIWRRSKKNQGAKLPKARQPEPRAESY